MKSPNEVNTKRVLKDGKGHEQPSLWKRLKTGYNPMEEGPKWTEKYADNLESFWKNIPLFVQKVIVVLAVILLGSSLKGQWIIIGFSLYKALIPENNNLSVTESYPVDYFGNENFWDVLKTLTWENPYMKGWWQHMLWNVVVSYSMYFGLGGFIHWYFYIHQRDKAKEWKCQPDKFLSPELERHEILLGSFSLMFSNAFTATISTYAVNGGTGLTLYYDWLQYGWLWLILQIPVVFILQDYATYWIHRIYHIPFLYKHFHKLHHKYKQPTVFSCVALHPVELLNMQLLLLAPMFFIPVHPVLFVLVLLYEFYQGILDHSGINFKAHWWQPWQPDAIFHDNHHQYTHVNFAFNMSIWDKLHNTYRKKDRVYNEDIFFGQGMALDEVSEEVLKMDLEERESENPLAYRSTNGNRISTEELKQFRKVK